MRDLTTILIVSFLLLICFAPVVGANDIANLEIPDNQQELIERYKDMAEIAMEYKALYDESKKDIDLLIGQIDQLIKQLEAQRQLLEIQDDMIDKLLSKSDGNFFINAGFQYIPTKNEVTVYVGGEVKLPLF